MPNHEGFRDPTADLAIGRVMRRNKKRKLSHPVIRSGSDGSKSGETALTSGKMRLSSYGGNNAAGRHLQSPPEENIPYSNQNGKYMPRKGGGRE